MNKSLLQGEEISAQIYQGEMPVARSTGTSHVLQLNLPTTAAGAGDSTHCG